MDLDLDRLKERVLNMSQFIQEYKWLWDMYFVEFYSLDLWQQIPFEWREGFMNQTITIEDLNEFIASKKIQVRKFLISFIQFIYLYLSISNSNTI